jgi:two-component system, NarL family, sensor histidine kinase NreB
VQKDTIQSVYVNDIFQHIQDGIIVMNSYREIKQMNPAAKRLTGWQIGDQVPYCSFCAARVCEPEEERCYLIAHDEVPYFSSQMPIYSGSQIDVQMSTALIVSSENPKENDYLLVLRDQDMVMKEKEAAVSKHVIKQLIEAKENEHRRLAQELHDGVGQSLYMLSLALQSISGSVQEGEAKSYLREVQGELDRVIKDVTNYSQQLRPKILDDLGLYEGLRQLVQSIRSSSPGVVIDLECQIRERLPSYFEINIYRVIQEALHNAIKHAEATHIEVVSYRDEAFIYFVVQDNGKGFEVDEKKGSGLGLQHMKERVHHLEGTINFTSHTNQGTTINARIPFKGD